MIKKTSSIFKTLLLCSKHTTPKFLHPKPSFFKLNDFSSFYMIPKFDFSSTQKDEILSELQNARISLSSGNILVAVQLYRQVLEKDPNNFEANNELGSLLYKEAKFEESLPCFEKAIEIKPEDTRLYLTKSAILYSLGRDSESLQALDKAIQIDPNYISAYVMKARTLESQGRLEEAKKAYKTAIDLETDLFQKGELLRSLDRHEEAIAIFDEIIKKNAEDIDKATMHKGMALFGLGKYKEALDSFIQFLKISKALNHYAYFNMGNCYRNLKQHDEAIQAFEKAASIEPQFIAAYLNLAHLLYELGKYKEALPVFEKVLVLDPNRMDALYSKAYALKELGKTKESVEAYDKIIELKPFDYEAYLRKGHLLAATGDLKGAVKALEKGLGSPEFHVIAPLNEEEVKNNLAQLEKNPEDDSLYQQLSIWYYMGGKWEEGIELNNRWIKVKPGYIRPYLDLSMFLMAVDQNEAALEVLEKAIRLDSSISRAYYLQAKAYFHLGLYENALGSLDSIRHDSEDAETLKLIGDCIAVYGKYPQAVEVYDAAIKMETPPQFKSAAYHEKAGSLIQLEKFEEALEAYDKSLELIPNNPKAHLLKGIIEKMLGKDEYKESMEKAIELQPRFKTELEIDKIFSV